MKSNMGDIKSYGIDAEEQLTSMLAEQLAKEIDREILKGMGIEFDRNKRRMNSIRKIQSNLLDNNWD